MSRPLCVDVNQTFIGVPYILGALQESMSTCELRSSDKMEVKLRMIWQNKQNKHTRYRHYPLFLSSPAPGIRIRCSNKRPQEYCRQPCHLKQRREKSKKEIVLPQLLPRRRTEYTMYFLAIWQGLPATIDYHRQSSSSRELSYDILLQGA